MKKTILWALNSKCGFNCKYCYLNFPEDKNPINNINNKESEDLSEDERDELFEKSIILPTQYEINEYQIVVDFIETIDNETIKEELQRVIQGKGAFRRFKDYCFHANIIQDWYEYKEQKYKEIAIKWCIDNKLQYID